MSKLYDRYMVVKQERELVLSNMLEDITKFTGRNFNKKKYVEFLQNMGEPILIQEFKKTIIISIDGIEKEFTYKKIRRLPITFDLKKRGVLTNISAIISGKKHLAVDLVAKNRRLPSGGFIGSEKTEATKIKNQTNTPAAFKTAQKRRQIDGTYSGIAKMVQTKTDNGTWHIASLKTAQSRRLPSGEFKGSFKTATTRRQRGYLSTRYGTPCVYQHSNGKWIIMRSKWEWSYAYHLDALGLSWEYEAYKFYEKGVGYIPDFHIEGLGFVEIKPSCFVKEEINYEYVNKYNIKVITEKDCDFLKYRKYAEYYRIICRKS